MTNGIILNEDIPRLLELSFECHIGENNIAVANTITDCFRRDVRAYKTLSKAGEMVGYAVGFRLTADMFYFVDIYVQPDHRYNVKSFVDYIEQDLAKDFKTWISNAVTSEGERLLTKIADKKVE
jgi:hypothetical protein